jgi:hypothetical protein
MAHWEEVEDIRHRFSLKLAEKLDQQKIGVQEAGKIIFDFNVLFKEKGDC